MKTRHRCGVLLASIMVLASASRVIVAQTFRPSGDDGKKAILDGNWHSCTELDGNGNVVFEDGKRVYAEREFPIRWPGLKPFEIHMGPQREFSVFEGITPKDDPHRDHDSSVNLLWPFKSQMNGVRSSHDWVIPKLGVRVKAVMAGGSRTDCESWYVTITAWSSSSS
jgi:hypothetical protein